MHCLFTYAFDCFFALHQTPAHTLKQFSAPIHTLMAHIYNDAAKRK